METGLATVLTPRRQASEGWQLNGSDVADRFSGDDLGRAKTAYMFHCDGFLDPDSRVECDRNGVEDRRFWTIWKQRKALQGTERPDRQAPPAEAGLFDGIDQ